MFGTQSDIGLTQSDCQTLLDQTVWKPAMPVTLMHKEPQASVPVWPDESCIVGFWPH